MNEARKKHRETSGHGEGGILTHPALWGIFGKWTRSRSPLELLQFALLLLLHGQLGLGARRPPEGGGHRERRRRFWHLQEGNASQANAK